MGETGEVKRLETVGRRFGRGRETRAQEEPRAEAWGEGCPD
jgi:hypothetical protein